MEMVKRYCEAELMTTNWLHAEKEWCRGREVAKLEQLLTDAVEMLDIARIQGELSPWLESMIEHILDKPEIKAIQEQ